MKLYILGAGSFAREVTDIVDSIEHPHVTVEGYVVDVDSYPVTVLGRSVWHIDDLPSGMIDQKYFIAAIMSPKRQHIIGKVKHFMKVIHPFTSFGRKVQIWDGCIVNRGVVIGTQTTIDSHCIINRNASIGHDCYLEQFVTIGPGANLAGNVTVEEGATIGMGANIREGTTIGANAVVGMGSVVLNDVPAGELWYGVPATKQIPKG